MIELSAYVIIGVFAGLLAGLLGIGGGLLSVPSMMFAFRCFGLSSSYGMHVAIGTSLGAMVFTSASSAWAHALKRGVYWRVFPSLGLGTAFGAVLGALIADSLPGKGLELIFGISICLIGLYFLIQGDIEGDEAPLRLPHYSFQFLAGIVIGIVSTLLGIGGGLLMVPYLIYYGAPIRKAVSTSAATGFVIAVVGAFSFFYLGKVEHGGSGYIYLPAFFAIGISSTAMAPIGAKLAYYLPTKSLRRVFGIFLVGVGISMLHSSLY